MESLFNDDDDAVSRRKTLRSASKQKLGLLSEKGQRPLQLIQQVNKKQKKKKKSSSCILSWQSFIQRLRDEVEDNNNSDDFYHRMIRYTYELPSDDDDDDKKRQFRLKQQPLQQEGKIKIMKTRRFTPNERKKYNEKVDASQGFDVVNVPDHICEYNIITPFPNFDKRSRIFERVKYSAKLALHFYNKQHKEEEEKYYQFVKVLKVNVRNSAGCMFYITFEAKKPMDTLDRDALPYNFQACVYAGITETTVEFCRPEQKSS